MRRRIKQVLRQGQRQKDFAKPGVSIATEGSASPKTLLIGFGLVVLALGLESYFPPQQSSSERASVVANEVRAAEIERPRPPTNAELLEKRKNALAELKVRDPEQRRLRRSRKNCIEAVERDSGHSRRTSWIVTDGSLGLDFYFTVDDPTNDRLFTAYKYTCDASTGHAEITRRDLEVGIKNERQRPR
ncbi:MAG: hypothetical protein JWQ49_915 [Edaphobacter sp.]|nr:hypothetical protein [Edaphobacter sp.]